MCNANKLPLVAGVFTTPPVSPYYGITTVHVQRTHSVVVCIGSMGMQVRSLHNAPILQCANECPGSAGLTNASFTRLPGRASHQEVFKLFLISLDLESHADYGRNYCCKDQHLSPSSLWSWYDDWCGTDVVLMWYWCGTEHTMKLKSPK